MKMKFSLKFAVLSSLLLATVGLLMTGCASDAKSGSGASDSVWASRIGNYTYEQATAEYGTATESHKLSDGGTTAEWLTRRNTLNPAPPSAAMQIRAGGIDQTTGANVNTLKNQYLRLNFDANGKLTKWEHVYR